MAEKEFTNEKPVHVDTIATDTNEKHFVEESLEDININNNTSASMWSAVVPVSPR